MIILNIFVAFVMFIALSQFMVFQMRYFDYGLIYFILELSILKAAFSVYPRYKDKLETFNNIPVAATARWNVALCSLRTTIAERKRAVKKASLTSNLALLRANQRRLSLARRQLVIFLLTRHDLMTLLMLRAEIDYVTIYGTEEMKDDNRAKRYKQQELVATKISKLEKSVS